MSSATNDTVTVTFNPTAINLQSDIISGATANAAGVMTAGQAAALAALGSLTPAVVTDILELITLANAGAGALIFSNTTRPPANDPMFLPALSAGRVVEIWNSDDLAPNYSDGVNWYDAAGNLA